ncbi:MAG TPA: primosomal protein N' [Gammaproteobacteria bacterium]|nr:primosomal protein N' [Gammaproteobacteria bacterium]
MSVLKVAVPSPLRRLFDYLLPADNTITPVAGARVLVPFGTRTLMGIIVATSDQSELPLEKLKPAQQILDATPFFSPCLMQLFTWAGNYYQYPLGMLFDAALPAWLRKQKELKFKEKEIAKHAAEAPLQLNAAQQNAVDQVLQSFGKFQAFLLDGVTGSGKTEVYMQLIAHAIANNLHTLILVPEINLTPQTLAHFENRFKVPIAVLHSQISDKNRAHAWLQAYEGTAPIILGTRLSAFTPVKNLGLIIIDEEHDLSFKQQDHFRYSARDLLLKRAQLEQCPIVLGSATPSLETWHNAKSGKFQHLVLPERAGTAVPPEIQILDIRHKQLDAGLTNDLLAQIRDHIAQDNQVLLFLNRRGYAPVLMCYSCGWQQNCKRCDSHMILHNFSSIARCHHCEAQIPVPTNCPNCNGTALSAIGLGTQRIEECLGAHFTEAKIARVDRDSVHTKKQLQEIFDAVHAGTTNILIGTQMLAKGHHFPNLSLVAIVDIDAALFSADFRATERIAQLITQVAGRAGRGAKVGKVVLQTTHPDNPLLQTLIYNGYHAFLQQLIQERQATNLPPYSYQVMFRAETKSPSVARNFLQEIKRLIVSTKHNIQCLGPIPAPMEKRQGFYRAQLLLQAESRSILQSKLQHIIPQIEANKLANKVRWSVDVDPAEMF